MALLLDSTYGAAYIGITISLVLYGVTAAQTIEYYRRYPKDGPFQKGLVSCVWLLDTLYEVFVIHALWHYLVEGKGNKLPLLSANWSLISQVVAGEIVIVIVECFFIYRITRFGGIKWLSILFLPSLANFGVGLAYAAKCYRLPQFTYATHDKWLICLGGGLRAVIALAIAVIMCCQLHKRGEVGLPTTRDLVGRLVTYAVSTGILTSLFSCAYVFVYVAAPEEMYYIALYALDVKMYVNSMMAVLNGRQDLRKIAGAHPNVWNSE